MRPLRPLLIGLFLAVGAVPALAAPASHTVPWYLANRDSLRATLATCEADPGTLAATPDCINAEAAAKAASVAVL